MEDMAYAVNHMKPDIPWGYQKDCVTLMVKDPYWLYAYWEITDEKRRMIRSQIHPDRIHNFTWALKVSAPSNNNSQVPMFITVGEYTKGWYIHTNRPNTSFLVEYGLLSPQNIFFSALTSNVVRSPRDKTSEHGNLYYMNVFNKESRNSLSQKAAKEPGHLISNGSEELFGISSYQFFSQYS